MKKGYVSVIVPVYNVERYLERCVESIINQTYGKLQIILIDDASKDKSGDICDKLAQKDSRICVFHKNWGGLADTRNIGLAFAEGEYISFVDSDDYIQDIMLEEMVIAMEKYNCDIAVCGRYDVFENGLKSRNRKEFCLKEENVYKGGMVLKEYFKGKDIEQSSCCDKIFRYSVIKGIHFPIGKTSEDVYFTYEAFKRAKRVVHVAKPLYYYLHRKNSITTTIPIDKTELELINFLGKIERNLWRNKNFLTLKAFYSFYTSTIVVLYEELEKSVKVDKSFRKNIIKIKVEALMRVVFIVGNPYIIPEKKKVFINMLLGILHKNL